ncbi:MAG: glycosyltransferase [Acidobacteria bacterium]|nr:glycosyltransferase [Acidobacteriota bacterium]
MTLLSLALLLPALALLCVTLWNVLSWPEVNLRMSNAQLSPSVSVLIPARDEETNLSACLDCALLQGEVVREILVYDDHSADKTPCIVEDYARRDPRVRLLLPKPLPSGWCGKTFACSQLAAAARGEWLLFLDADVRLRTGVLTYVIAEAQARGVSLLSCWPALELLSFWERVLMPMLNFVVFTLYPAPLAFRRRGDASLGLAHGSCILARRDVYVRTGGHELVRDEIFEDVRLAQAWRARGERSLCLDGQRVLSVRMYRSFGEIWRGFQKNFFPAFKHEPSFWAFIALHFSVFLLPFIIAPLLWTNTGARAFFALELFCVLIIRLSLALRFRHPSLSVVLHPLGEVILIALGLSSWWRCRRGRGVEWKGRRYRERVESTTGKAVLE